MAGVFQNIDPPPPSPPGECVLPAFGAGGGHTCWLERGWGVNILEDVRHSYVLYVCKYFVHITQVQSPTPRRLIILVATTQSLSSVGSLVTGIKLRVVDFILLSGTKNFVLVLVIGGP